MRSTISWAPFRGSFPVSPRALLLLFRLSAGGVLMLGGLTKIFDFFSTSQAFEAPDPIFAIPLRDLIMYVGILELIIGCFCLVAKRAFWGLALAAWLIVNLVEYRVVLWVMGWHHPYAWLSNIINDFDVSPIMADWIAATISLYLFSGLFFWWWNRDTQLDLLKIFCPGCGGRIKFATQILGQKIGCPHCKTTITLRKPDETLKTSCFFCHENIEFPAHALGRKIKCPHCKMEIGLKESAGIQN